MKLSRIAAAVTTAALAPVVLIASPAFAAGNETAAPRDSTATTAADQANSDQSEQGQSEQDRKTILAIIADPMASAYMKEAGHKAIAEGPAAMRKFIETDQHEIRRDDYRVAITRLLNDAGPVLKEGVGDLLSAGTATLEELRHFYEVTQHELRDQDNRVAIAQIIDAGGPEVIKAGRAALAGTAADRSEFLATGQYEARAKDEKAQQQDDGDSGSGGDDNGGGGDSADATGGDSDSADGTGGDGSDGRNDVGNGNGKQGTGNDSGTSTGNTAVAPQGSRPSLASTGAGDAALVAGGAGTALVAGAGILLAARMRRAASMS